MRTHSSATVYAARWIVPVTRRPIHRGWIRLDRGRITEVAAGAAPTDAIDLGDVAILPGWVNAHTHLEFSDLASPITAPSSDASSAVSLPSWIAAVVRHRGELASLPGDQQYRRRQAAIESGLRESAAAGVRLLAEIATEPWPAPDAAAAHTDIVALGEVLGLSPDRQQQTFSAAIARSGQTASGIAYGLSPHAPYSTTPELVDAAVNACRQRAWPLAMHVAESSEELELIDHGSGPFRQALESIGVWRDGLFPWPAGIDGLLRQLAAAPRCLVVHGNYLTDGQIRFLASQPQMTVVYCPRTHAFFGHPRHPVDRLMQAGVRVALGTDSRASNPDLNLWNEVRYLLQHRSDVAPADVLRMATWNGALALGRSDCGCLQVGATPGLLTVPTAASDEDQLWSSLGPVAPEPLPAPSMPVATPPSRPTG